MYWTVYFLFSICYIFNFYAQDHPHSLIDSYGVNPTWADVTFFSTRRLQFAHAFQHAKIEFLTPYYLKQYQATTTTEDVGS